jgi:hypothetical protein
LIPARVLRMFIAGQQVWIGDERQILENVGQVPRTDFTGSTRALHGLCQTKLFFGSHRISTSKKV